MTNRNPIFDRITDYDFKELEKAMRVQERDMCQRWIAPIEAYQQKLAILKNMNEMPISQGQMKEIYNQSVQAASNRYAKDLRTIEITKAQRDIDNHLQILKEEINQVRQNYEELSQFIIPAMPHCLEYIFQCANWNGNVLVSGISSTDSHYILLQVFERNNYQSAYFQVNQIVKNISVTSIDDNSYLIAYGSGNKLFVLEIFQSVIFFDKQLYELTCENEQTFIIDSNTLICINQGIVYMIHNKTIKTILQLPHNIIQAKFKNDQLALLTAMEFVTINLIQKGSYNPQQLKIVREPNDKYQNLLHRSLEVENLTLDASLPQQQFIRDHDVIIYLSQGNCFRFYDINSKTHRQFELTTQMTVAFFHYDHFLQKLIFCDGTGQTYFLDRLVNYIN